MDIERAFETYIEHEKPSGWDGWTAQNMLNAFKAGAEAMETVEADVDRLKIELENACRERNELKAENTQLKELLRRAWNELEMRAIEPDLTDEIEQAL
jgi:regulator of replication initiation timing